MSLSTRDKVLLGAGGALILLAIGRRTLNILRVVKSGRLTEKFGWRIHPVTMLPQHHDGIDIGAPTGTDIYAAEAGTVSKVVRDSATAGNYVVLAHASGLTTTYMHMNTIVVNQGASVAKGQVIGTVGATGRVTGPHLHFQANSGGDAIDPINVLA